MYIDNKQVKPLKNACNTASYAIFTGNSGLQVLKFSIYQLIPHFLLFFPVSWIQYYKGYLVLISIVGTYFLTEATLKNTLSLMTSSAGKD